MSGITQLASGACLMFSCLAPTICSAQDLQPFSARVYADISADEDIEGEVRSYINRELRSLGDIIVTDSYPDWVISIVALETKTRGGHKSGVTLSVVVLRPFKSYYLVESVTEENRSMVNAWTKDLHSFSGHWLRTGAPDSLKSICEGIVADFDSRHIEPERQSWQELVEMVRRQEGSQSPAAPN